MRSGLPSLLPPLLNATRLLSLEGRVGSVGERWERAGRCAARLWPLGAGSSREKAEPEIPSSLPLPLPQGIRFVIKDSKKHIGEKLVMAFIEFSNTYYATECMNGLQVCQG